MNKVLKFSRKFEHKKVKNIFLKKLSRPIQPICDWNNAKEKIIQRL